jgi:hypothetical protein
MYGSVADDPVVRYYDRSFGVGTAHELNWYLCRARKSGGPVLDLA